MRLCSGELTSRKERSSLCPWLLGIDLEASGMSCLIGGSWLLGSFGHRQSNNVIYDGVLGSHSISHDLQRN